MRGKKGIRKRVMLAMALLLAALPLLSGCAPKEVLEDPIRIGNLVDLTGPTSSGGITHTVAWQNYIDYLNKEKGGINGHPIDYMAIDTGYEPPRAIAGYQRLKAWGAVIYGTVGTPLAMALRATTAKDKIPQTSTSTTSEVYYPPGWIYCQHAMTHGLWMMGLDWILEGWSEPRPLRIATLTADIAVSRSAVAAFKPFLEKRGVELVAEEYAPPVSLDFIPYLIRIRAAEPDWVFTFFPGSVGPGTIAKDSKRLAYQVNWLDGATGMDTSLPVGGEALEGWYLIEPWGRPEDEGWGIDLAKYLWDNYSDYTPGQYYTGEWAEYIHGLHWIMLVAEAVRMSLEEVGYENLTGAAVKEYGLDKMSAFDTGGLTPKISFTDYPGDRIALDTSRILKVEGGRFVPTTDWRKHPEEERPEYVVKKP